MKAIILAAGVGKRLYPLTADRPKGLVEVNNIAIMENLLRSLLPYKKKISEILIVTGFKKEKLINRFGKDYRGLKIKYINNEIYEQTNNIYSLTLASDHVDEDVLLFESDVFFEHNLIARLIEGSEKGESIAVVDRFKPWMDGSVITIENGYISELISSKSARHDDTYKTVNIYYFTREFFTKVFMPMLNVYMQTHSDNHYYEIVLKAIIHLGYFKIRPLVIEGLKWYEIDDQYDLQRAEFLFKSAGEQLKVVRESWGGYWNYEVIDYNFICNAFFPDENLIETYKRNLQELITAYPSTRALINKKLADALEVDLGEVLVCNGACEGIKILMGLMHHPVVVSPNFGEYTRYQNADYFELREEDDFELDLESLAKWIKNHQNDGVIITNPNNPTSKYISMEKIRAFIEGIPEETLVILDTSFADFVPEFSEISCKEFKNLVIVKSLGKCFGTPGLRLGYLRSANEDLIKTLDASIPIWNINSFAEFFLDSFQKFKRHIHQSYVDLAADKMVFIKGIEDLNANGHSVVDVVGSDANFLFCRLDRTVDIENLAEFLFQENRIIIKNCTAKIGSLDYHYLRLNVLQREQNAIFVESLGRFLEDHHPMTKPMHFAGRAL